jgi:hypothetical protein
MLLHTLKDDSKEGAQEEYLELNLEYIKVGQKRTIILRDGANWCTNQKVIAENG